jgi:DNA-binding NtrC family response regulator
MERLKILLVDDEEDLVSALAERLTLRGFQVETATKGGDALTHVSAGGFNVVILDVKMPGIGGVELMVEIMRKQPDLPVILFTGHGSVADAKKGMEEGAFDYVMKPIDIDDLIRKIGNAAGRKTG